MSSVSTQEEAPPRRLMPVLFAGVFMAALDTAVIAPAIPALRQAFALDNRAVGLVMTLYILFSMCSAAPLASLGDRHGRRPVFLASVALFALGSLLIALSANFATLLVGRAIQGIGGGGIIPTASAVIGDALPPRERGRALGLLGATHGMAFVLGPPLAATVMVALSWHWIFLANLPIAAVVLLIGARVLPSQRRTGALPPLDWPGIALAFALLGALVLGITRVADGVGGLVLWPWMLAAAALLLPALVAIERRAAQPVIPLSLFDKRPLRLAYLLTAGAGFGMGSVVFLTSVATLAHGASHDHVGYVLLPLVLSSMLGSVGSGRLLHRQGSRAIVTAGFAMMALGYLGAAFTDIGLWGFMIVTMPIGLGVGIVVGGALRMVAIDEAPPALRGAAQGLVNVFMNVGTLLAATTVGALADFSGGGAHGLAVAYGAVAGVMLLMWLVALGLPKRAAVVAEAHTA